MKTKLKALFSNRNLPYFIISTGWLILFLYTGNISSHIGIMDDHEILNIAKQLENTSLTDVLKQWLISDFHVRFRPLYIVHRILMVYFWGTNFALISLYICFLGIISSCLFVNSFTKLGYNNWYAFVFLLTLFIGPQIDGWSLFGAQENLGIFILSLVFFTMSNYLKNHKKTTSFFFFISLVLLSLTKESFILTIPGLLAIYLYLEHKQNKSAILEIFKKKWFFITIILLVAISEIIFIKFIQKPSYSISQQGNPLDLVHIAVNFVYISFVGNLELIIPLVILSIYIGKRSDLLFYVILFVLIVIPQCIAHKVFQNRYYLPGLLFFSFTLMDLLNSKPFPFNVNKHKKTLLIIFSSFIFLGIVELIIKFGNIIITKNKSFNEFVPNSLELTTLSFIIFSIVIISFLFIKNFKYSYIAFTIFLLLILRGNLSSSIYWLEQRSDERRVTTESLLELTNNNAKNVLIVQDATDGISFELSHLVTTYLDTKASKTYEIAVYFPNSTTNEKWKGSLQGSRYAIGLIDYEDKVKCITNLKEFSPDLIFINERKDGLIENQLFSKNKDNLDKAFFKRKELPIGRIIYVRKEL